ncbi:MAG: polysaccharide deacetylase family protein [Desulforegulaceae bacterium]|nr:polysaccharide deacetylase family protein [Desulforegulaceae bacterium]
MKNKLSILTFHRIVEKNENYFIPPMAIDLSSFKSLIKSISFFYDFADLKISADEIRKGKYSNTRVAITFDDGYKDNYDLAMPILKKYKVPATFFIPVNQIENNEPYWWDYLFHLVKKHTKNFIIFFEGQKKLYSQFEDVSSKNQSDGKFCRLLVQKINLMSEKDRDNFLNTLKDAFGAYAGKRLLMNWKEIEDLSKHNFSIGSHTLSHIPLTDLSESEVEKEVNLSKKLLEEKVKTPVNGFCYPRGAWNKEIEFIVKKAGYDYAVTTEYGTNTESFNLYSMKRKNISDYMGLRNYFPTLFYLLEISGILDPFLSKRR